MKRRALALLLVVAAFGAAWLVVRTRLRTPSPAANSARVVSLSPAITETLFALGKGASVVAVSDYCNRPPEVKRLPRVGTGLTPRYEAITRLNPSLILAEQNAHTQRAALDALASTELLPWLTLDEMTASIRRIGRLTGSDSRADALANRLHVVLSAAPAPNAPRVLLVFGYSADRLTEVWYAKRNTLHGNVLRAAGGENAVARDEMGAPRLSLPEVIALDPDVIVILAPDVKTPPERWLDPWRAVTPLRAVARGGIGVLRSEFAFGDGPSILELVDALRDEITRLRPAGAPR